MLEGLIWPPWVSILANDYVTVGGVRGMEAQAFSRTEEEAKAPGVHLSNR